MRGKRRVDASRFLDCSCLCPASLSRGAVWWSVVRGADTLWGCAQVTALVRGCLALARISVSPVRKYRAWGSEAGSKYSVDMPSRVQRAFHIEHDLEHGPKLVLTIGAKCSLPSRLSQCVIPIRHRIYGCAVRAHGHNVLNTRVKNTTNDSPIHLPCKWAPCDCKGRLRQAAKQAQENYHAWTSSVCVCRR